MAVTIDDALGQRAFACFPVAVLAIIIAPDERVLLLNHPERPGEWEVVSGALEAGETIIDGLLREVGEELGAEIDVQPLATVHASTFRYDVNVTHMISLSFVLAYRGGDIHPGDDMSGSTFRWWTEAELMAPELKLAVPQNGKWMLLRALELFRNQGRQATASKFMDET
ncbi:MAG: NUDIX hydrolase [Rhodospirillaceae bacterium]|nr:NUDIX hydrolase [Rhodospirillaceae bacterium]